MASQKYNILYGRLSQEDERQRDDRQRESNSIHNQKLFLEQYAANHGFENTLFLADDGYSGTNFDRPAWKKVIEMVERDEVETIIVKDLSRLGREYLQVGQYTEIYFPEKGVPSSRSTTAWIPWWRAATTLILSVTGPTNSTPRTPVRKYAPSRRCRRSAESGWAANRPTATRKRTRTPRRSSPMRKPLPSCVVSLTCAPQGRDRTRSPES